MKKSPPRPATVRVFGRDFAVIFTQNFAGMEELGLAKYNEGVVVIQDGQVPLEEADTVLHEFIHIIDNVMDLSMTEHQVTALSKGLMGVFQDNPDFAKFIVFPRSK